MFHFLTAYSLPGWRGGAGAQLVMGEGRPPLGESSTPPATRTPSRFCSASQPSPDQCELQYIAKILTCSYFLFSLVALNPLKTSAQERTSLRAVCGCQLCWGLEHSASSPKSLIVKATACEVLQRAPEAEGGHVSAPHIRVQRQPAAGERCLL